MSQIERRHDRFSVTYGRGQMDVDHNRAVAVGQNVRLA
jgi:hypothetical protein